MPNRVQDKLSSGADKVERVLWRLPSDGWVAVGWFATGVLAWLAVILILPTDTFGISDSYSAFAHLASEEMWGALFGISAGLGVWGNLSRSREVQRVSCILLSVMHMLVALCFLLGNAATTGTGTYVLAAILVLGRLVVDGRLGKV